MKFDSKRSNQAPVNEALSNYPSVQFSAEWALSRYLKRKVFEASLIGPLLKEDGGSRCRKRTTRAATTKIGKTRLGESYFGEGLAKLLANCFVEVVVRQVEYFELGEFVEAVRQALELVHSQISYKSLETNGRKRSILSATSSSIPASIATFKLSTAIFFKSRSAPTSLREMHFL